MQSPVCWKSAVCCCAREPLSTRPSLRRPVRPRTRPPRVTPEMKQARNGRNWYFGMKLHIGADKRGIIHTVTATDARAADITQLPALLHGQEREIFGDQAYWKEADRQTFTAQGVRYRVNRRPNQRPLTQRWRLINRGALADPRLRRTRVLGDQAGVRLYQG